MDRTSGLFRYPIFSWILNSVSILPDIRIPSRYSVGYQFQYRAFAGYPANLISDPIKTPLVWRPTENLLWSGNVRQKKVSGYPGNISSIADEEYRVQQCYFSPSLTLSFYYSRSGATLGSEPVTRNFFNGTVSESVVNNSNQPSNNIRNACNDFFMSRYEHYHKNVCERARCQCCQKP